MFRRDDERTSRACTAFLARLVRNMIAGVKTGYEKRLEIDGVGYLATIKGNVLQLRVGLANELHRKIPTGLTVTCPDQTHVVINGCDKQQVGQFAAEIRSLRKPEPYKGKAFAIRARSSSLRLVSRLRSSHSAVVYKTFLRLVLPSVLRRFLVSDVA
ncbi:MAG: 50S ribosomal protein L6 [Pirellulales bacterium]